MVDSKIYAKPITFKMPATPQADTEMLEGFCEDHHKIRERLTATKPAQVVQVPAASLSRCVGTYDTERMARSTSSASRWTGPHSGSTTTEKAKNWIFDRSSTSRTKSAAHGGGNTDGEGIGYSTRRLC